MHENTPRTFGDENLSDVVFRETFMPRARMIGVVLVDAVIDGMVENLTVNDVEVTAYVRAELDLRYPVRLLLRSHDPDELRAGWAALSADWKVATARLVALGPEVQHARVDGEWSASETLRHLVFVTDGWFRWAVLGTRAAFDPMGLAPSFVPDQAAMGLDGSADPSFDGVVEARTARQKEVSDYLERLTVAELGRTASAPDRPGWPIHPEQHTVLQCVHTLLEEEFAHYRYCVRDLAQLT